MTGCNDYSGEERRNQSDTCQQHEKIIDKLDTTIIKLERLIARISVWGTVLLLLWGAGGVVIARTFAYADKISAIEVKQKEHDTKIDINTNRLTALEGWRYQHMEEENREPSHRNGK